MVDVIAPNAVNGDDALATLNEATSLIVTVDVHTMPVRHIGTAGCNAHQCSCTTTVGCQRSYFGCQNSAIVIGHTPDSLCQETAIEKDKLPHVLYHPHRLADDGCAGEQTTEDESQTTEDE